ERQQGRASVAPVSTLPPPSTPILTPDLRRTLPLIDRESELASTKSLLDATMRGEGNIVFLEGEAGIGKTRLAEELKTYATLRGVKCLSGKCLEKGSQVPYAPWIEIIRALTGQTAPRLVLKAAGTYANEIAKLVPE